MKHELQRKGKHTFNPLVPSSKHQFLLTAIQFFEYQISVVSLKLMIYYVDITCFFNIILANGMRNYIDNCQDLTNETQIHGRRFFCFLNHSLSTVTTWYDSLSFGLKI